jgi:hypothetical protein
VGKLGEVTQDKVKQAGIDLIAKIRSETGMTYARDYKGKGDAPRIAAESTQAPHGGDFPFVQLAQRAAEMLRDWNDKAARQAQGEVFKMGEWIVVYERIEPGTVKMNELVEGALERLDPRVMEWYLTIGDRTYEALVERIVKLAEDGREVDSGKGSG